MPDAREEAPAPAAQQAEAPETLFNPRYLRKIDPGVASIVDVGVNHGTPALYRAFARLPFLLVDPQQDADARLRIRPHDYRFANVALGAHPGAVAIHEEGGRSTALERTAATRVRDTETYQAEVTTLDLLLDAHRLPGPIGLKIDTEGYELEVLKGLERHIGDIGFIICEASIRRRFVGGYAMADLVGALKAKGFDVFNFLNAPKEKPNFYDLLFLREDNPLFG
jgi:FkbM family methyltransferase